MSSPSHPGSLSVASSYLLKSPCLLGIRAPFTRTDDQLRALPSCFPSASIYFGHGGYVSSRLYIYTCARSDSESVCWIQIPGKWGAGGQWLTERFEPGEKVHQCFGVLKLERQDACGASATRRTVLQAMTPSILVYITNLKQPLIYPRH